MTMPKNASNEETLRAEVECLRRLLSEKDKIIAQLKMLVLDNRYEDAKKKLIKNKWDFKGFEQEKGYDTQNQR